MGSPSSFTRVILMLLSVAVLCAQVAGVRTNFLCSCSGTVIEMLQDACFGQQDDHCHHEEAPEHQNGEGHPEVADALEAVSQQFYPVAVPAPPVFDFVPSFILVPIAPCRGGVFPRCIAWEDPPPPSDVFRSMVLLI